MNIYNDYLKNIFASAISSTILYPIDYIKTILQNNNKNILKNYINNLYKKNELHLIYRGFSPQLFIYSNSLALEITIYNYFKKKYNSDIIAGSLASIINISIINPIEVIKVYYQTNIHTKIKTFDLIKKIGIKNLYKGSNLCFMRDVPYAIVYYSLYNNINQNNQNNKNNLIPLYSAVISSIPATICATPFDVIKTRYQILDNNYNNIYSCVMDLYKQDGIKGFFKGNTARLYKNSLLYGFTFLIIENINNIK